MDKKDWISNKIAFLVKNENYKPSQAAAIAFSLFEKEHKMQEGGSTFNYAKTGNVNITSQDLQNINQGTGIEFTPEFGTSYFSGQTPPVTQPTRPNYSQMPIVDITSDGEFTNRKVWRTQRPEWFVGKREPIEGQDYTTVPYNQWAPYQRSQEYINYTNPQDTRIADDFQQGGNAYAQQGLFSGYNQQFAPLYKAQQPTLTQQPYQYQNRVLPNSTQLPNFGANGFQYDPNVINTQDTTVGYEFQPQTVNPLAADAGSGYTPIEKPFPQISSPYGMSLEQSFRMFGEGLGENDPTKTALGGSLSALKLGRSGLGGYAYGKENKRVQDEYLANLNRDRRVSTNMQQGGSVTNSEVMTGAFAVETPNGGNITAENGEILKNNQTGNIQEIVGDTHKNGGVEIYAEDAKILSDFTKIGAKNAKELKERYKISLKKTDTFATAMDKINKQLGVDKLVEEQAKVIEKIGENNFIKDETTRALNDGILQEKVQKSEEKLEALKGAQNFAFEDIFELQEQSPKRGNGELINEDGSLMEVNEEDAVAQQGGTTSIIKNRPYGEGMLNNWWNSTDFNEEEQKNIQKDFDFINGWYKNRKFIVDGQGKKIPVAPTNIEEFPDVNKENLRLNVKGSFRPTENSVRIDPTFLNSPGTYGHELNHKYQESMVDKNKSKYINNPIYNSMSKESKNKYFSGTEDEKYKYTPEEIHSRLMQFRMQNNIKPEQIIKKEDLQNFDGRSDLDLDILKDDELMNMLNRSVNNYIDDSNIQYAQQGGQIDAHMELAKRHGISPERATELMQMGGSKKEEYYQEGGQQVPSPEEIVQAFAQATQQDPQAIIEQLQSLSPEEQQQALQSMMTQLQQNAPQEEVPTQEMMQAGGQIYAQEGVDKNFLQNSTLLTDFTNPPSVLDRLPYTPRETNPNEIWRGENYSTVWKPLVEQSLTNPEQAKKIDEWLMQNKNTFAPNVQKQLERLTGEKRIERIKQLAIDEKPGLFHNAVLEAIKVTAPEVVAPAIATTTERPQFNQGQVVSNENTIAPDTTTGFTPYITPPTPRQGVILETTQAPQYDRVKRSFEAGQAALDNQLNTREEQIISSGLPPQIQQSLMANEAANIAGAQNQNIASVETFNAQNQQETANRQADANFKANLFNVNQRDVYFQRNTAAIDNQNLSEKVYNDSLNRVGQQQQQDAFNRSLINASAENYRVNADGSLTFLPPTTTYNPADNALWELAYSKMTPKEQEEERKRLAKETTDRINAQKKINASKVRKS